MTGTLGLLARDLLRVEAEFDGLAAAINDLEHRLDDATVGHRIRGFS